MEDNPGSGGELALGIGGVSIWFGWKYGGDIREKGEKIWHIVGYYIAFVFILGVIIIIPLWLLFPEPPEWIIYVVNIFVLMVSFFLALYAVYQSNENN